VPVPETEIVGENTVSPEWGDVNFNEQAFTEL
jgi:hypothetical protein